MDNWDDLFLTDMVGYTIHNLNQAAFSKASRPRGPSFAYAPWKEALNAPCQ